jgi:N-acetylmuramoyl-L-alanine amidase
MKFLRLQIRKILLVTIFGVIFGQQVIMAEINRPTLTIGNRGTVVTELQAALKLLGYYDGSVNGIYSESSAIAVTRFQEAAGLEATGIVDAQTWRKLFPSVASLNPPASNSSNSSSNSSNSPPKPNNNNSNSPPKPNNNNTQTAESLPILREGMEHEAVKLLQNRLKVLGFYQGLIDGIFGRETLLAVIQAQTRFRIDADGIVGTTTWKKLLE